MPHWRIIRKLSHGVGPHGRVKARVKNLPDDHPPGELYDSVIDSITRPFMALVSFELPKS